MIFRRSQVFKEAFLYCQKYPHALFLTLLLFVLPLALAFAGQYYLEANATTQQNLQKDKVSLIHDTFASLILFKDYQPELLQHQIEHVSSNNPEITKFRIATFSNGEIVSIAAKNTELVGVPETQKDLYRAASANQNSSLVFEFFDSNQRYWQALRSIKNDEGTLFYVFIESSMQSADHAAKGSERTLFVALVTLYVVFFLVVIRYIRKTNLRYKKQKAQKMSATKDLFSNAIANELKAPLTAINGYSKMVSDESTLSATNKKHMNQITDASSRLLTIVNTVLDVARIESGNMTLHLERVDLVELLAAVLRKYNQTPDLEEVSVSLDNFDESAYVLADKKWLQQILFDVLSDIAKSVEKDSLKIQLKINDGVIQTWVNGVKQTSETKNIQSLVADIRTAQQERVNTIPGAALRHWVNVQVMKRMQGSFTVKFEEGTGISAALELPISSDDG